MKRVFAILCLALCLSSPVRAEKPKIALLPFDIALPQRFEALKDGMPDIVTACFTAHAGAAEILDRAHIESIAEEAVQNFDIQKIRLESATHLLRGSLAPHEDGIVLTLMLYDLASAQLAASATSTGGMNEIAVTTCKGVEQLAGKLAVLKPATAGDAAREEEKNNHLMIEGLGYYYNGAYEQSFASFMKLAREAPESASARYWLGKSYLGAQMTDEARIAFSRFAELFPDDPRHAEVAAWLEADRKQQEEKKKKESRE